MKQSLLTALYIVAAAVAATTQVGCGSPLVGLECENGYAQCGGGCYDPNSDPDHCGGCDIACDSNEMCISGACTDDFDGSIPGGDDGGDGPDGSDGDASSGDGGFPDPGEGGMDAEVDGGDAGAGDGGARDGGFADVELPPVCTGAGSPSNCACELGELLCGEDCVTPSIDPLNCGGCGNDCNAVPPPMGEYFCVGGRCQLTCDDPYLLCDNLCVDSDNDPTNCGACSNVCLSGLCEMGTCLDSTAGHVIVIGHDLGSVANTTAVRRIAQNAMFLPPKPNIRGLVYKEFSRPAAVTGVESVIGSVTAGGGQNFTLVAGAAGATSDEVPFLLARSDVFVIVSQADATDSALLERGDKWARALRGFVRRGGVIVLFDGGGTHAGTHQILQQAGLFEVAGRTPISARQVNVEAPGDAVASLVPMRYQAQPESVGYTGNDGTTVVSDRVSGLSVVIHIAR